MALKTRFCAKCGKETDILMQGLCAQCTKEMSNISMPHEISLTVCSKCGAARWQGVWAKLKEEPEYYLKQRIIERTRFPEGMELANLELLELGKPGKVKLTFRIMGKELEETRLINLELNKSNCPDCSARFGGKDFVAAIYVRGVDKAQVLNLADKFGTKILKTKDQKRGIDILFWDKRAAGELARLLNRKLGLKMSRSSKAYSWRKTENKPKYQDVYKLEPQKVL